MEPRAVPLYPAECGDELLYRIWDVQYACQQLVAPDEPIPDRVETAAYLRSNPASERRWYWTVGDVDGFAEVSVTDGQSTAWLDLYVAPDARRRGAGRALLEAAAARAKEQGCKHLIGEYVEPGAAGFVRAVGAREGTDRLRYSVLRLPLRTGPVPDVPGYERVSWTGSAPEELLASYAQARNAINDAPHDDAVDEERYTPERVRDLEADAARRDRTGYVTVALDPTRTVVAYTEVQVARTAGASGFTGDTAVVAAHRRRGLALWIKDGCLRRLAAQRPDVTRVLTENDVTNAPMLAVNDRLGFVPSSVRTEAILDL
ncbi:MAG: acetyltransferase [Actinobacteria bacterium]|nr:MAG: acetyltransferase [Actinomycetota bacterium]